MSNQSETDEQTRTVVQARAGEAQANGSIEKLHAWAEVLKVVQEPAAEAFVVLQRILDRVLEGHVVLQKSGAQKLQHTSSKLQEVTSATETAAMDIMDAVGRALELVDRLETEQPATATSGELRDELFGIMDHLQFQDVTTQQLQYTSSLLEQLEGELLEFVSRLGLVESPTGRTGAAARPTFDPNATMAGADDRQAAADQVISTGGAHLRVG